MATKTRTPKTPEQQRLDMEALHARLDEQVETLRTTEGWKAYLTAARFFTRYSVNNVLLILSQCPEATEVASYRAWLARGRQVRKDEKSLRIYAPCSRPTAATGAEDDGGDQGDAATNASGRAGRVRFRPQPVFDISQTDQIEGAEQVASPVPDLDAEDEAGLYERVAAHFELTGVALRRSITAGGLYGYTRKVAPAGRASAEDSAWVIEVVVDERSTGADAALTALHEAAHIAGDHLEDSSGEYVTHRGRYEIEAESAAYIVAGIAGLDTGPASTGYVATWMDTCEAATLKATAATALSIARTLTTALGLDAEEEDAAEDERQHLAA